MVAEVLFDQTTVSNLDNVDFSIPKKPFQIPDWIRCLYLFAVMYLATAGVVYQIDLLSVLGRDKPDEQSVSNLICYLKVAAAVDLFDLMLQDEKTTLVMHKLAFLSKHSSYYNFDPAFFCIISCWIVSVVGIIGFCLFIKNLLKEKNVKPLYASAAVIAFLYAFHVVVYLSILDGKPCPTDDFGLEPLD